MITVSFNPKGYTVNGHAEYAEHGRDVVCASVSAVAQTTLLGLSLYGNVSYEMNSGLLIVRVHVMNDYCKAILDTMEKGVRQIAWQYPDYVEVKK